MAKNKCCWVLRNEWIAGKYEVEYCGRPTSYKVVLDDDSNKVRKYNHLCDHHMEESKKLPIDEDWS